MQEEAIFLMTTSLESQLASELKLAESKKADYAKLQGDLEASRTQEQAGLEELKLLAKPQESTSRLPKSGSVSRSQVIASAD